MASLFDLLQAGKVGGAEPDGSVLDEIKRLLAEGGAGVDSSSVPVQGNFGSLAPITEERAPAPIPRGGTPYAAPVETGSIPQRPAPRPAPNPDMSDMRRPDGLGTRIGDFLTGLSGEDALAMRQKRGDSIASDNLTVRALMGPAIGLDEATAKMVARNPSTLQAVLNQKLGGKGTYGVHPIWGKDKNGKPVLLQLNSRGEATMPTLPTDVELTPGIKTVDDGTGTQILDLKSGDTKGRIAKDVQGEAREKKLGSELGERAANLPADRASLEGSTAALDQLIKTATDVHNHPGLPGNFGVTGKLPNWPGGNSADANARLTELKAKVGFAVLQAMREASKTGGALGSITEGEHKLLQNAMAALDGAQSFEQVQSELRRIVEQATDSKDRLKRGFEDKHGSAQKPSGWGIRKLD